MLRLYYSIFCVLFSVMEKYSIPRLWSEWKACVVITVVQAWIVISLKAYVIYLLNDCNEATIEDPFILITVIGIIILNVWLFGFNYDWKIAYSDYIKMKLGNRMVLIAITWGFIFLSFCNLIFSFYLVSKVKCI